MTRISRTVRFIPQVLRDTLRWASAAYPFAVVACFIEGVKRNRSVQWQSIE